jgi:hypothetical protein
MAVGERRQENTFFAPVAVAGMPPPVFSDRPTRPKEKKKRKAKKKRKEPKEKKRFIIYIFVFKK